VKENWAFANLPYTNRQTDINWDAMHIMKNWGMHLLELLTNKRAMPVTHSRNCYTHPYLGGKVDIPWVLAKKERDLMNILLQCVCLPKAYAEKYKFEMLFDKEEAKHYPFLKAVQHIYLLTIFLPFLVYQTNLPKAYKSFFAIVSEDFSDLLAHEIRADDLPELFERLSELVAIKEGIFPDSEGLIIYHQIMDLRIHIEQFGPLRNSWAFPGEKAMSKIKATSKEYHEKQSLSKQNVAENDKIKSTYSFGKEDNLADKRTTYNAKDEMCYNDSFTELVVDKTKGCIRLETIEPDELFKAYILEVYVSCGYSIDKASSSSSLFRLYLSYRGYCKNAHYGADKFELFRYLCVLSGQRDDKFPATIVQNISTTQRMKTGELAEEDLNNLPSKLINFLQVTYYKECNVYGIKFSSRDPDCRETTVEELPKQSYGRQTSTFEGLVPHVTTNKNNNLKEHWNDPKHYSAWVKINIPAQFNDLEQACNNVTSRRQLPCKTIIRYGQVNMYFDINLSIFNDELPKVIIFSSITARVPRRHELLSRHYKVSWECGYDANGKSIISYDSSLFFVPVANFCSTAVALCAFDVNNKPIYGKNKDIFRTDEKKEVSDKSYNEINYFHMLDLHPMRRSIGRNY
jgi:hypothetical protein